MSLFLRLLAESDKAQALAAVCQQQRQGEGDERVFEVAPEAFDAVPGKPFAYWVSEAVRETFTRLPPFESDGRTAQHGGSTKDDFRYLHVWWEAGGQWSVASGQKWFPFAKGGAYSPFYADIYLAVNWADDARELEAALLHKYPYLGETANWVLHRECRYLTPGLTWPRRTTSGLSLRVMPAGCIFADKGPAAFVADDAPQSLLALLALTNSQAFGLLVSLQLAAADAAARSYEVGVIQKTPIPDLIPAQQSQLAALARRAWSLKRRLDTINETSHAFALPAALAQLPRAEIEAELAHIQAEIDAIAFDLYGFSEADRQAALASVQCSVDTEDELADEDDEDTPSTDHRPLATDNASKTTDHLLSWAVGVAFGRFDWRLATGERAAPPEPEPFDPLPAKSPGMLPDAAAPFYAHAGILVDDPGHPHDLARLTEEVLETVVSDQGSVIRTDNSFNSTDHRPLTTGNFSQATDHRPLTTGNFSQATDHRPLTTGNFSQATDHRPLTTGNFSQATDHRPLTTGNFSQATDHRPLTTDHRPLTTDHYSIRRWLQRDFFAHHLKQYSKSRRKAPIYWPLATTSGSYTLWLYYPSLSSQTLYTAINDFIEPKLKQVSVEIATIKAASGRLSVVGGQQKSLATDHRSLATVQDFELELIELRDTLLGLAPTYKPNHDDGVQISAAPLWQLFRHKPWQKVLKDTWAKLEKGDYDWAHLAMNYWPERVREKCKTDKSLAIAHGLEHLYIEPEAAPKKTRKKKGET